MSESPPLTVGLVYDDSLDRRSGVARHVLTLAGELRRRGHRVAVLAGETRRAEIDGVPVRSLSRNVAVAFHGNRLSTPLPACGSAVRRALRAESFDVLDVQMPYSPLMAGRVVAAAEPRTAVVGTFHVASERALVRLGARALRLGCRRTLRRFDRVVAVSQTAAAFAARCFGLDRCPVTPNMVDVAWFRASGAPASGSAAGGLHVVFLGSLVARKGVECLLRAFALLEAEGRDARLTVAGDGPRRGRLERLSRDLGLERVAFEGAVDERRKRALLASADVACFPSRYGESFGIVLLEAMAAGAGAVLGGRNDGYAELLRDCPRALVEPSDTEAFAAALRALSAGHEAQRALHACQQRLVREFDVAQVVPRIVAGYRQALLTRAVA